MRIYHALTSLHNMPLDWKLLWGDSDNLLHPVLGCSYNESTHKTHVTLFKDGDFDSQENKLSVKDFANMLLRLPMNSFSSTLVFNNFQKTNSGNAEMFEFTSEIFNIKGFRKAKYTVYDTTLKQYKKHHYVRMMLFNNFFDRRG